MRSWAIVAALLPALVLSACSSAAPAVDMNSVPKGVEHPLPDEGTAAQRAAVRAAVVEVLGAEEDQLSRTADGEPRATPAERSARLHALESDAQAEGQLDSMALLTAKDVPFRSADFAPVRWQGVVVRGDRAKAYVLGHVVDHRWDGTDHAYPDFQYKTLLTRSAASPTGWRLLLSRASSNEQG